MDLCNRDFAELLAVASETAEGQMQRALRRASRKAMLWPEEAADLWAKARPLTDLPGIGPSLQRVLLGWLDDPPPINPPPLRQDFLTWTEAQATLAPHKHSLAAIQGDLHLHSTWSDGSSSIEELGDAAIARGYHYLALTDHSKGLTIAGGMDEATMARQHLAIAEANQLWREQGQEFVMLRSLEMNLSPDGSGDMEPDSLEGLDLVVGSFHSSLRKKEDQTERYLLALRNPHVHILGHPRGRIYNFRLGLQADWPAVFAEAARLDKAVEIDSFPDRQDLNRDLLRVAGEAGVRISLGSDSHNAGQCHYLELGLAAALQADIPLERIINFMPLTELLLWARSISNRT